MTFILKNPKAEVETPILMTYYFNGKRLKFSTGEKIHPDYWNPRQGYPRKSAPLYDTLTTFLQRMEARVREVHLKLKAEFVEITPETLRNAIINDVRLDGGKDTLLTFAERYIAQKRKTVSVATADGLMYSMMTVKNYPKSKDFADISHTWLEDLCAWMTKKKYAANSQGKIVRSVFEIMDAARREGLHRNDKYRGFVPPHEDSDSIYLSEKELMDMYELTLADNMAHVRDRFIISAFTGLRFSDTSIITMDNIRNGMIFNRNKKTQADVVVPIHWVVEETMKKYPSGLPPSMSKSTMNRRIKDIGELAGIKGNIVTRDGTFKKFELITSHTARRSFATNAFLAGIPALSIMLITGHKTEAAFKKYIRISAEENGRLIASHDFFKRV